MPPRSHPRAVASPESRVPSPGFSGPAVHVGYATSRRGVPAPASFRRWVSVALAGSQRRQPTELSIRVVGAHEGRSLNQRYRDRNYATNVLSFPVELPCGIRTPLIGDLVVCAPVVTREARAQHKAVRDHYAHLTVHGVLHLLGYDHEDDGDAQRMEALEIRILASIGIADPYASP